MTLSRRTALVLAAATCAATAGPALAADETENVQVSMTVSVGGSRQFDALEETTDTALKTLDLGTGGSKAFRTRVTDTSFESLNRDYTVTATMSNLYLRTAQDPVTKVTTNDKDFEIPSEQLTLTPGGLSVDAPLVGVVPQLTVSGTLSSCNALSEDARGALGLPLTGLITNVVLGLLDPSIGTLCNALGSGAKPVTGTVDGVLTTVQSTVNGVTALPNALTAGAVSPFTVPDYAHDVTGKLDAPANPGTPTGVQAMHGARATSIPTALLNDVVAKVDAAIDAKKLTDTVPVASLLPLISDGTLRTAVTNLGLAERTALLDELTTTAVTLVQPTLSRLRLTTNYYGKPTLSANLTAPVSGTYDGTMTLTFVQT